jgi:hypothetical protein
VACFRMLLFPRITQSQPNKFPGPDPETGTEENDVGELGALQNIRTVSRDSILRTLSCLLDFKTGKFLTEK